MSFLTPAQSSAGLATLIELQGLLQSQLHTTAKTLAAFTDFVFNVQVTKDSGSDGALATLAPAWPSRRGTSAAGHHRTPSSGRSRSLDWSHPQDPLSGRYPVQGRTRARLPPTC